MKTFSILRIILMFLSGVMIGDAIMAASHNEYIKAIYCLLFACLLIGTRTIIANEIKD